MAQTAEQLPRGRHRLSREQVAASQRRRMLAAMTTAVAEEGYVRTTVADVIAGAGVSRETFYQHFSDKEECFLAAFDAASERLVAQVARRPAGTPPADPIARLDGLVAAYLAELAADPALSRVFLVEVYAAGPRALERRMVSQQRFVDAVASALELQDDRDRFACEAFVAAVSTLVTNRIGSGRSDELVALRAPLIELVRRAR